jgi:hypothetical protein
MRVFALARKYPGRRDHLLKLRLINAQSSTEITHPICLGGLVFNRRYGLKFRRRRHHPGPTVQLAPGPGAKPGQSRNYLIC